MSVSAARTVLGNTLVSALAFGVVGAIGLALVPVIVGRYGLATYGLLMLARAFVPAGLIGVFDPGLSEQTIRAVSRARVDGDWSRAGTTISTLLVMAAGIGVTVGLALAFAAEPLAAAMRSGADNATFVEVVRVTGLAAAVLFPALILEGLVKGLEDFRGLRAAEVACTALYAIAVVALADRGAGFEWIAYAYLASLLLKAAWLAAISAAHARRHMLALGRPHADGLREAWRYGRHLAASRILSTLRDQGAAPAIGALLGPTAVGVYDVISRLPRFLKTVLALLNSTLLPLAARLHHGDDGRPLARLAVDGMTLAAALAVPVCATGAILADPLLRLWIGPDLGRYAPWLGLMFVVPALNAVAGMVTTTLLPDESAISAFNRVTFVQTASLFAIGIALLLPLEERAFIASTALVALLAFPVQLWIAMRSLALTAASLRPTLTILVAGAAAVGVASQTALAGSIGDPVALAAAGGTLGAALFAFMVLLLPNALRARVWRAAFRRA